MRSQGISSLPSVLGVFQEATSFPPRLQLPADQPIRGSFFFSLLFFFQPICTSELLLLLTCIYLTIFYLTSKIFQHWGDPLPTLNSLY